MRDKWYGDNRDLVKWTTLVHIARACKLRSILQVPYWRPESEEELPRIVFSNSKIVVTREVWGFFRDIRKIVDLGDEVGISIGVIMDEFNPGERAVYLRCVRKHIAKVASPVLLFLDPDTGLQPKHVSAKHTTFEEVKDCWATLRPRDWLVLYQHARRQPGWEKPVEADLARLCNGARVKVARSEKIGKDVLFLCAEKLDYGK